MGKVNTVISNIYRFGFLAWILTIGLITGGCKSSFNLSLKPITNYPAVERLDTGVALVLEKEFAGGTLCTTKNAVKEVEFVARGTAMANSAEALCSAIFREVHVVKSLSEVNRLPATCSAVVRPHMASAEFESNKGFGGFILHMEWTVSKRDGDLVWQKSFRGQNSSGMSPSKQAQRALEQIFRPAFTNMYHAEAVRALAQPVPTAPPPDPAK